MDENERRLLTPSEFAKLLFDQLRPGQLDGSPMAEAHRAYCDLWHEYKKLQDTLWETATTIGVLVDQAGPPSEPFPDL